MSDESGANAQVPIASQPAPTPAEAPASTNAPEAAKGTAPAQDVAMTGTEAPKDTAQPAEEPAKPVEAPAASALEKHTEKADVEMKDIAEPAPTAAVPAGPEKSAPSSAPAEEATPNVANAAATATPTADKFKARRKSGAAESKGKKLNKKASKARILHTDAKPGDHFFVKLKGYPPWPAIVCDEDMLPQTLIKTRPVTAARTDGTYREDYADGGKRAADRTFPVMYLSTNEFGWVPNTDLLDLDPETVLESINDKMRKDLQKAHQLASEAHPLNHYKDLLQQFQEELEAAILARQQAQATPAKKSKKNKAAVEDEDEDVSMVDADDGGGESTQEKKTKKRKADDDTATPQRSDSVKKPKIKITSSSTPKNANGVPTPKSAKSTDSKPAKTKTKKKSEAAEEKKAEKEAQVKEPELSPEEKHQRKEKEVLFLRHKLQKGLLTRDQEPKVDEMETMSGYVTKLEMFPDLEVSIIRATKINKVLKAILKLDTIPKEEEFQFKARSQSLLDKWNLLLAVEGGSAAAESSTATNGVNGKSAEPTVAKENGSKAPKTETTNGVKEDEETKAEAKPEVTATATETQVAEPLIAAGVKEDKPAADEPLKTPQTVEAST